MLFLKLSFESEAPMMLSCNPSAYVVRQQLQRQETGSRRTYLALVSHASW